jgi:Brp/Blh family beta-carotene 15,15'-monooxygenase
MGHENSMESGSQGYSLPNWHGPYLRFKNTLNSGAIFLLLAVGVATFDWLQEGRYPQHFFSWLGLAIVILGVPHGALDVVYAKSTFKLVRVRDWIYFFAVYLICAGATIVFWKFAPSLFFGLFLLLSVAHFSTDIDSSEPLWVRGFYGGSIVVLPFLLHAQETARIFAFFMPVTHVDHLRILLEPLSAAWFSGALAAAIYLLYRRALSAFVILGLILLFIFVPPLVAFTTYFCFLHSPRHIGRALKIDIGLSTGQLIRMASLPTFFAIVLFILLGWGGIELQSSERRQVTTVFVGLAALTVPHMILLYFKERISGTRGTRYRRGNQLSPKA